MDDDHGERVAACGDYVTAGHYRVELQLRHSGDSEPPSLSPAALAGGPRSAEAILRPQAWLDVALGSTLREP